DAQAQLRHHLAVDAHAAALDQLVGGAARAHAGHRQPAVEPHLAVVRQLVRRRRDHDAALAPRAPWAPAAELLLRAPVAPDAAAAAPAGPAALLAALPVLVPPTHAPAPGSVQNALSRPIGDRNTCSTHPGTSAVSPGRSGRGASAPPLCQPSTPL